MITTNVLEDFARGLLTNALQQLLTDELSPTRIRLFLCDSDEENGFVRFAGLVRSRWALFDERERGEPLSPTLAVGLLPSLHPDAASGIPWLKALLDWPGFAYLPYGFSKEQLLSLALKVVEGARTHIPLGLLPTHDDMLHVNSEVRHWLDNRSQNVERALKDFSRAARREDRLHPSHLEPVPAISDAHRRMLERLWALERAALRFAPMTGGLAPMKAAVEEFETCWVKLESLRESMRSNEIVDNAESLMEIEMALKTVLISIENAIVASRVLDDEIHTKMVMR